MFINLNIISACRGVIDFNKSNLLSKFTVTQPYLVNIYEKLVFLNFRIKKKFKKKKELKKVWLKKIKKNKIIKPLTIIFNKSLQNRVVLNNFKLANLRIYLIKATIQTPQSIDQFYINNGKPIGVYYSRQSN